MNKAVLPSPEPPLHHPLPPGLGFRLVSDLDAQALGDFFLQEVAMVFQGIVEHELSRDARIQSVCQSVSGFQFALRHAGHAKALCRGFIAWWRESYDDGKDDT